MKQFRRKLVKKSTISLASRWMGSKHIVGFMPQFWYLEWHLKRTGKFRAPDTENNEFGGKLKNRYQISKEFYRQLFIKKCIAPYTCNKVLIFYSSSPI